MQGCGFEEYHKMLARFWRKNNYSLQWINSGKTLVFFTSHGLIGRDPTPARLAAIVENDLYEWKNISSDINCCNKIFVRDLKQSWYLCGINNSVDSVLKVCALLKSLIGNTELVTVGNSAGGFAAILFGCLLQARHVISCSGQVCLHTLFPNGIDPRFHYLSDCNQTQNSFFNLEKIINRSKNTKIFCITPARSEQDNKQYEKYIKYDNIYSFRIDSDVHGYTPSPKTMQLLLLSDTQSIIDLHGHCANGIVSGDEFNDIAQRSLVDSFFSSRPC